MKIKIEISTDNAAFGDPCSEQFGEEVWRILEDAADKFRRGYASFPLFDSNGNNIGRAGLCTDYRIIQQ